MSGLNEAKTRKELIDPALKKAGWDVGKPDQVGIEIPVDGFDPKAWEILKERLKHLTFRAKPSFSTASVCLWEGKTYFLGLLL